jgi:hypothetical protein
MTSVVVKEFCLNFTTKEKFAKENLRFIVIKAAEEILQKVNSCQEIQQ